MFFSSICLLLCVLISDSYVCVLVSRELMLLCLVMVMML